MGDGVVGGGCWGMELWEEGVMGDGVVGGGCYGGWCYGRRVLWGIHGVGGMVLWTTLQNQLTFSDLTFGDYFLL